MTGHANFFETRASLAQRCLTDRDRTLLHAVTGWHMPGMAITVPEPGEVDKEPLIPLLAWVIADARRHGRVQGDITPGAFEMAVISLGRAENPALRLSSEQIAQGRCHLAQIQARAGRVNPDRAAAAAG